MFAIIVLALVLNAGPATNVAVSRGSIPVKSDRQKFREALQPAAARASNAGAGETHARFVPGEVVVRFKPHMDETSIASFCEREQVMVIRKGRYIDYYELGLPIDLTVEAAVREFSSCNEIEFAEPDYVCTAQWLPNDPYYWNYQWDLRRNNGLDMQLAWELTTGSSAVTVAVVDCGVAYEDYSIPSSEQGQVYSPDSRYHLAPDLANTQFVQGYDFVSNDGHPNDEMGHGTHVAGTIAQSTNNGIGCAGMAFGCKIMPVRVLDQNGSGTDVSVAEGISYAYQNGANVVNLSLGSQDSSNLEHSAIIDATNAGAVVVAAAGNDGTNYVSYPAAFSECIAVGAVDGYWQKSYYSNWGVGLDVVAPGGDLSGGNYWPIKQNTFADVEGSPPHNVSSFDYVDLQGTSMATPHVAALVAMMMSRGIRNPTDIKVRLYHSTIDLGSPGWDTTYGYGLVEPVGALGGQRSFLAYDNDSPDNYWYVNNGSDRMVAVLFTPDLSAPFNITEASALVWDRGGMYNFRLTLNPLGTGGYPDTSTNLAGPVTFTTVGDSSHSYWYTWDFPGVPRTSNGVYALVFHWVSPNWGPPFIGGDTTNIDNRSCVYSSSGWSRTSSRDWYLRTVLLKDTLTLGIEEGRHRASGVSPDGITCIAPQPTCRFATITYCLSRMGAADFEILDLAGRVIRRIDASCGRAGSNEVVWNGLDDDGKLAPSGVYFVQLTSNGTRYRSRVVVSK